MEIPIPSFDTWTDALLFITSAFVISLGGLWVAVWFLVAYLERRQGHARVRRSLDGLIASRTALRPGPVVLEVNRFNREGDK